MYTNKIKDVNVKVGISTYAYNCKIPCSPDQVTKRYKSFIVLVKNYVHRDAGRKLRNTLSFTGLKVEKLPIRN